MKPSEDFSTRYSTAKRWRDGIRPLIEEVFRYTCPGREKDFGRTRSDNKTVDETTTFTSLGEELAGDLGGDFVTYYTPAEVKWANYIVTAPIQEDQEKAVLAMVQEREDTMHALLQASNYNDIAPQWGFEAASHGTPALWSSFSHIAQPIHFEVVPPHELLLTPGHLGYLDRFREKRVLASSLVALFTGYDVNLSEPELVVKMKKPGATCVVCWGFWIDWSDPGNPMWHCEITVDQKPVVAKPIILGTMAGACPLLVGRFNPRTGMPWGRGPGIKALPDLRTLDKVNETVLSGLDQSLMNTIIYADDGFMDLSEGIDAGRAYPAHRGFNREQVYDLSRSINTDQGWFTAERLEAQIRTAFFQDGPRQRGDTPPTAAQWLDERRRVQQRLGKPSAPIWSELIYPLVQRVEFMAVQMGRMPEAITHDGQSITVAPISPLQKAQNQDKVMVTRSNLELAMTLLADQLPNFVDVLGTLEDVKKASGDDLLKLHKEPVQNAAAPPAQ